VPVPVFFVVLTGLMLVAGGLSLLVGYQVLAGPSS
jgi:hypothetical protein